MPMPRPTITLTVSDAERARYITAARRYTRAATQLDAARDELVACVVALAAEGHGSRPIARELGLPVHVIASVVHRSGRREDRHDSDLYTAPPSSEVAVPSDPPAGGDQLGLWH
jgi:transposase-like protein